MFAHCLHILLRTRLNRAIAQQTVQFDPAAPATLLHLCLAAIQALPRYQDQGRPFLAFVYGIASHKVADAHRAAGRNRSEPTEVVPERLSLDAGP